MADHSLMKLGKQPAKFDLRTLRLGPYLKDLPAPPISVDWTKGNTSWDMMLNDTLGCCTIAGIGHGIQILTLNAGSMVTVPDSTILLYYEEWDGYVNGDASTDNGGVELDVLKDWKNESFSGHVLDGFVDPHVANLVEIKQAIYLLGGLYIGVELPITAQNQDVWDVVPDPGDGSSEPGSWGGHCVFVTGYDSNGINLITWGQNKKATWAWWIKYCSEAHGLVSNDFFNSQGVSPEGFNKDQLMADLAELS